MIEVAKNIWNRKFLNCFLIIQFILVLTYFFMTTASIQKAFNLYIEVPKILQENKDRLIHIEVQNDEVDYDDFKNIYNKIKKDNNIEDIVTFENNYFQSQSLNFGTVSNLRIDLDVSKITDFTIEDGRFFEKIDYDNKNIPVIVGSELAKKDHLKVGDSIKEDLTDKKYQVIGIMKRSNYWFQQSITDGLILSLDNQVITLIPKNDKDIKQHYYAIIASDSNQKKAINAINNITKQSNVYIESTYIGKELEKKRNQIISENFYWFVFSISMIIMLSIGTAILTISHLYSRKKEIGIRLAVGYSPEKIFNMLTNEIIVIVTAAYIISCFIGIILIGNGIDDLEGANLYTGYAFTPQIAIMGAVATWIMCIPTIIAIFVNVKKIQPKNLIGGKE